MPQYTTYLKERREIATGTMAVHFEKPAGFSFKPGQFVELSLLPPREADTHPFSIASAPHEEDIMIATRMRDSAMKRTFRTMPLGTEVLIDGPYGDFVLHKNAARATVFLTGGIGITPFRSMALRAVHEQLPHQIFLFYANRTPQETPFLDELRALESQNPHYRFIPTMTRLDGADSSWWGERGHITKAMLLRYIPDLEGSLYYSAGPQGMVAAMRTMLNDAGVDDDTIRTEEFSGY